VHVWTVPTNSFNEAKFASKIGQCHMPWWTGFTNLWPWWVYGASQRGV